MKESIMSIAVTGDTSGEVGDRLEQIEKIISDAMFTNEIDFDVDIRVSLINDTVLG
jgi:hypothetical protein